MDERLLLKEKDYEQAAIKRRIEFKHSFNDPLINPTKKKKTVKRDFLVAKPAEDSGLHNNVLTKTAKPKTQLAEPSA